MNRSDESRIYKYIAIINSYFIFLVNKKQNKQQTPQDETTHCPNEDDTTRNKENKGARNDIKDY
jgi:hypothetical protein